MFAYLPDKFLGCLEYYCINFPAVFTSCTIKIKALVLSKWRERGDDFKITEEESDLIERVLNNKAEAVQAFHWKPAHATDYRTILSLAQLDPADKRVLFEFLRGLSTHTIHVVLRRMNLKPSTQEGIMAFR